MSEMYVTNVVCNGLFGWNADTQAKLDEILAGPESVYITANDKAALKANGYSFKCN